MYVQTDTKRGGRNEGVVFKAMVALWKEKTRISQLRLVRYI